MNIGIPKEVKPLEGRVALTPEDCEKLVQAGHQVWVETGAGLLSGYRDQDYLNAAVRVSVNAAELYRNAELIVKVKEPVESDLALLTAHHTLFCFLHLAPNPALLQHLLDIGLTAVGFETLEDDGGLPILKPMSEVAGRVAVQVGAHLLHQPAGGRGILLGGVTGTERGRVTVLGAGVAGGQAALLAAAMGAQVRVLDKNQQALSRLGQLDSRIECVRYDESDLRVWLCTTDLLIGAVLIKGARTPRLVTREMVASMPQGSVLVDISVDQGGCVETTRPTSYDAPTYLVEGVTHFCVSNMPGAVPRTATQAISAVLPPYIDRLTDKNWLQHDATMRAAVNVRKGEICLNSLKDMTQ